MDLSPFSLKPDLKCCRCTSYLCCSHLLGTSYMAAEVCISFLLSEDNLGLSVGLFGHGALVWCTGEWMEPSCNEQGLALRASQCLLRGHMEIFPEIKKKKKGTISPASPCHCRSYWSKLLISFLQALEKYAVAFSRYQDASDHSEVVKTYSRSAGHHEGIP